MEVVVLSLKNLEEGFSPMNNIFDSVLRGLAP